ncbi:Stk1 family PASTA domain-containing Ser/Thr kinase [Nonomuraea sp. NPDC059023]|uniref:Stk1 family PASTA domain-containing Ser/Thr kinase n=1 Tax=unclassified Nonomuraea TaxID=2593643 RepID=UPI0036B00CF6
MDTTTADPLVGRLLDGRYRIESRIARGGMATVYLALDVRLDRTVALKVMHRSLAEDPAFVRRFIGEAKSVASLSHPNVVHVFDQGTDGDIVYLSMEYVPGKTLRDILRERVRLPAREALEIMIPVLAALGAAHQSGMVHRDVKPENVLLTDDGRVKVVDFGLARAIEATNQTRTGVMIGTIGYMSPEQVTTGGADVRSDVYAAGIMLFELVTGQQPYDGETPMSVAYRHVHDSVPPPSSLVHETPPLIDTLVTHATARDPQDRPADATAMLVAAVDAHRMLPRQSTPPHTSPHSGAHARMSGPQHVPPPSHTLIQPRADLHTAPPAPPRRSRGSGKGFKPSWFLIGLATVMVAAIAMTGAYFAQTRYVKVPTLIGENVDVAIKNAQGMGFVVKPAEGRHDEKYGKGLVLSTDPVAGSELAEGSTLTIVPSLGPKRVAVPKTQGMSEADARAAIAAAGLQVGNVRRIENLQVPRSTVIRSSPDVGEQVKEGSKIGLFVSAGLIMPDVGGMPKDEAAAYLGERGLGVQVNEVDDDAEPCTVIAQSPKAKSEVDKGTPAQLTISRCRDFFDWFRGDDDEARDDAEFRIVPQVIGKTVNDARSELSAQGFKVRVRSLLGGDVVRYQRPTPNSERPPGALVYLWR